MTEQHLPIVRAKKLKEGWGVIGPPGLKEGSKATQQTQSGNEREVTIRRLLWTYDEDRFDNGLTAVYAVEGGSNSGGVRGAAYIELLGKIVKLCEAVLNAKTKAEAHAGFEAMQHWAQEQIEKAKAKPKPKPKAAPGQPQPETPPPAEEEDQVPF